MKILRRLSAAFAAMILMLVLLPSGVSGAATRLVIYHTNDIHGRAEGTPERDDKGDFNQTGSIGYARYKQILDADRALGAFDAVLALDAGDALHGTLFAQLSSGEDMIDLMKMTGIHAMACGNHDFGFGPIQLKELERRAAPAFPLMAANVRSSDEGGSFFKTNQIMLTLGGKNIVIFGIATPETKVKAHASYTRGLSFGAGPQEQDPEVFASSIQAIIDALPPADLVIMLGHLGVEEGASIRTDGLVARLSGLDLVIDGHSHTICRERIRDKDQKEVLVVQAGCYFENIGRIEILLDAGSVTMEAGMIPFSQVRHLEGDPGILAELSAFNEARAVELGRLVGRTATRLVQSEDREGGQVALVRMQETNLGNLVADSMCRATGADLALINGGGIRADLEAGPITYKDAVAVLPLGNLITVIEVTGRQLLDALRHGARDYPGPCGGFLQVSGLSYVIETRGRGDLETFQDIGQVMVGDKPLEADKTYTLATSNFLVAGGDGYTMFEGARQLLLSGLMLEALIDEIEELTQASGPEGFTCEAEGRIRVRNLSGDGAGGAAGTWAAGILTGLLALALTSLLVRRAKRKRREES